MAADLSQEIPELRRLSVDGLRRRYAELFGETTRSGNKSWLLKRIAWRLQALDEGGLSEQGPRIKSCAE